MSPDHKYWSRKWRLDQQPTLSLTHHLMYAAKVTVVEFVGKVEVSVVVGAGME